jgi:hypothetical protein
MRTFEMKVVDTFHFANGSTVFIGSVEAPQAPIPECECEIVVGNEVKGTVRIDGEMIAEKKTSLHRSVSTSQSLNLAAYGIAKGDFTLRSKV